MLERKESWGEAEQRSWCLQVQGGDSKRGLYVDKIQQQKKASGATRSLAFSPLRDRESALMHGAEPNRCRVKPPPPNTHHATTTSVFSN